MCVHPGPVSSSVGSLSSPDRLSGSKTQELLQSSEILTESAILAGADSTGLTVAERIPSLDLEETDKFPQCVDQAKVR